MTNPSPTINKNAARRRTCRRACCCNSTEPRIRALALSKLSPIPASVTNTAAARPSSRSSPNPLSGTAPLSIATLKFTSTITSMAMARARSKPAIRCDIQILRCCAAHSMQQRRICQQQESVSMAGENATKFYRGRVSGKKKARS